jgi:hypothetical protein
MDDEGLISRIEVFWQTPWLASASGTKPSAEPAGMPDQLTDDPARFLPDAHNVSATRFGCRNSSLLASLHGRFRSV